MNDEERKLLVTTATHLRNLLNSQGAQGFREIIAAVAELTEALKPFGDKPPAAVATAAAEPR